MCFLFFFLFIGLRPAAPFVCEGHVAGLQHGTSSGLSDVRSVEHRGIRHGGHFVDHESSGQDT